MFSRKNKVRTTLFALGISCFAFTGCIPMVSELLRGAEGDQTDYSLALLGLGGSSGGGSASAGLKPGVDNGQILDQVSRTISADSGGTLYLNNELAFTIPPGSLETDTKITIQKLDATPAGSPDGLQQFGQAYKFLPAGLEFAMDNPAVLEMALDGSALAAANLDGSTAQLYYFNEELGRYVNTPGVANPTTGKLTALVEHFTAYLPVAMSNSNPPGTLVTQYQGPLPNPARAGAPLYIRYRVSQQAPPGTGGYTGGSIVQVRLFYRKIHAAPVTWTLAGVMERENIKEPRYGTLYEDSYGYLFPETFLASSDLGAGADVEFYVEATDNLGVTQTSLIVNGSADGLTTNRVYDTASGNFRIESPGGLNVTAGFSRTYRVRGQDTIGGWFNIPLIDGDVTATNSIGSVEIQRPLGTFIFTGEKVNTGLVVATMGSRVDSDALNVSNGQMVRMEILDFMGNPFTGPLSVPGRTPYQMDVRGYDAFDNEIFVVPQTWNLSAGGTIANGQITGNNTPGIADVTATLGGITSDPAQVDFYPEHQVSVNVTGVASGTLSVNASGQTLNITADNLYNFPAYFADMVGYGVSFISEPLNHACHLGANALGTITGDVTVDVDCFELINGSVVTPAFALTTLSTLAGTGVQASTDGVGGLASFHNPHAMATDGKYLYVNESFTASIRRVEIATGEVTTWATGFVAPGGITVLGDYLYVVDQNANLIRRVDIATATVTAFAGTGAAGFQDGADNVARFNNPVDIATDGTYLYVADLNNRVIRRIDPVTRVTDTIAGSPGMTAVVDAASGSDARFISPTFLDTDGTYLYVAERNNSHVIRRIDLATTAVTTIAGQVNAPDFQDDVNPLNARFDLPSDMVMDSAYLYIADRNNHRIRRYNLATGEVDTLVGDPALGVSDTDGTLTTGTFNQPVGLASDGTNLYVSTLTGSKIRKLY